MSKKASASEAAPVITCRPVLPVPPDPVAAARTAVSINPANAVPVAHYAAATGDVLPPERIAVLTSKYWGSRGVKLTVSFMDNPTASLRKKIIGHMNAWGSRANVKLTETKSGGQVRISREPGTGYASYLGPDILHIPAGQATMWLDSFTDSTPDSEFYRVVRHETGHTLGFPHEHMRKDLVKLLDPKKTIAFFQSTYGWDAATTTQQVLTPLSEASLVGTPVDARSIMCYSLPSECTRDGKPILGGLDIDPSDFDFAAKIYPKSL